MTDRLAHLAPRTKVTGLVPGAVVEIVEATPVGSGVFVRYRDDIGLESTRVLTESDLGEVVPVASGALMLDAVPDDFALAIEALRLRYAHLLSPLLAISSSNVEALPHQVQAVYEHLLRGHPQRFLLADDPGAGKTIMAGLYLKEALARGWIRRCVIIVPGGLAEQWQEELAEKFALRFQIYDASLRDVDVPFLIARLDQFARNPSLIEMLVDAAYDLAIFDEAHKLSARFWGSRLMKSKRFELGEAVRDASPNLLLMTATPHNGKEADFQKFLSLLRDAGAEETVIDPNEDGLMRRLVKEQLVHLDGSRLFPERTASTVAYHLTPLEHDLYEDVSEYVREEMNKVSGDDTRRSVGFALLVLQRRLASSPEAILRSLTRRLGRLQAEADRVRAADRRLADLLAASLGLQPEDPDELNAAETEAYEDNAASVATAARTLEELETEILVLERLAARAEAVRDARVDTKWEALAELLTSEEMYDETGARRKIVIFTEHRDTLEYLEGRLFETLPTHTGIEVIHGAIPRPERRLAQTRFVRDNNSSILLATDAAGEGFNLQAAHLMVNYDIPWNPNRLEQRFGRIHRIGQRHRCHLWNLAAVDTREGEVFATLLRKLDVQREALGDQVFDVLGEVLTDSSLRQLLERALGGAAGAEIEAVLEQVTTGLQSAVAQRAATAGTLTTEQLTNLQRRMSLAQALSFQPDVVRAFTLQALQRFNGDITARGATWQVQYVPERLRSAFGSSLQRRYDAVTFDRSDGSAPDAAPPELIAPGHPLLAALVDAVDHECGEALRKGVVLEDDREVADYVIVTALSEEANGEATSVDTFVVRADGGTTPASAALYTDLSSSTAASAADIDVVNNAVGVIERGAPTARVMAVAFVRGTARAEEQEAWTAARVLLQRELTDAGVGDVVAAVPGEGWDWTTGDGEVTCWSAVPSSVDSERRRSELRVANNIGADHYRVRRIAV